jgi:hypothetical protein
VVEHDGEPLVDGQVYDKFPYADFERLIVIIAVETRQAFSSSSTIIIAGEVFPALRLLRTAQGSLTASAGRLNSLGRRRVLGMASFSRATGHMPDSVQTGASIRRENHGGITLMINTAA